MFESSSLVSPDIRANRISISFSGPNGVGKTTFAREFLPHYVECLEFVYVFLRGR